MGLVGRVHRGRVPAQHPVGAPVRRIGILVRVHQGVRHHRVHHHWPAGHVRRDSDRRLWPRAHVRELLQRRLAAQRRAADFLHAADGRVRLLRHRSGRRRGGRDEGPVQGDSEGRAHHRAASGDLLHRLDRRHGGADSVA
jgi:2A0310: amino acid permease (yeast)